jgi:GDP-D-mannose dehydratase
LHDGIDIVARIDSDATKAREILGWAPKVSFRELVQIMVENDIKIEKAKNKERG